MNVKQNFRRIAAAAALTLAAAGAAQAQTIAAVTAVGNFVVGPALTVVGGMTTPLFANAAGQRFIVHFAAECAVSAPAGNTTANTDVDIFVLNSANVVVAVLAPTGGNLGVFCSADGSAGLPGFQSNAVIAVGGAGLSAGAYRVQVRARLNSGFAGFPASYGERTLIVTR